GIYQAKSGTVGRPDSSLGRNQGAIGIPRAPGTGHRSPDRTRTCAIGGSAGAGSRTDRPNESHAAFPGLAGAGGALYPEALRRGRMSPRIPGPTLDTRSGIVAAHYHRLTVAARKLAANEHRDL